MFDYSGRSYLVHMIVSTLVDVLLIAGKTEADFFEWITP